MSDKIIEVLILVQNGDGWKVSTEANIQATDLDTLLEALEELSL